MTEGVSKETLKPCPFCGGEAYATVVGRNGLPWVIACMGCGCSLTTIERSAWNARAEGPAPPGGGGEEDYRGSLRSAPGSTSHRTDGAGECSKGGEEVAWIIQFLADYFAPWGAWKTEWWEHISGGRMFGDNEALLVIKHKLAALTKGADRG